MEIYKKKGIAGTPKARGFVANNFEFWQIKFSIKFDFIPLEGIVKCIHLYQDYIYSSWTVRNYVLL